MLITLVSATPFEIQPTFDFLSKLFEQEKNGLYTNGDIKVRVLITGVGLTLTAFQLGLYLAKESPSLLINAGVAGALNTNLKLGDVVQVVSEQFGDLGAEAADGQFLNIHELKLIDPDEAPFQEGRLINEVGQKFDFLPKAKGVTVNTVHGYESSIQQFKHRIKADVETMEGAAVFLACLQTETSFLAIRAISNFVEPRNRDHWELGLAIKNLNAVLRQVIDNFILKN